MRNSAYSQTTSNKYWISLVSSNFNNSNNWSDSPGGNGGSPVPGPDDAVFFDGNGIGNCNIDINVEVASIMVLLGYNGSVTQNNYSITVNPGGLSTFDATFYGDGISFYDGTFVGGNANIRIKGDFNLNGSNVNFTSTSALMEVSHGNFYLSPDAIFNHNNGKIKISGCINQYVTGNWQFSSLDISGSLNCWPYYYELSLSNIVFVYGTLEITGGGTPIQINTGQINALGNITILNTNADTTGGGNGTINICGTGNQLFIGSGIFAAGKLPNITIDKPSGTLFLASIISLGSYSKWKYVRGNIDGATYNSTVAFTLSNAIEGSHALHNVEFYPKGTTFFEILQGTELTVNGMLRISGEYAQIVGINSGTIISKGDIIINRVGESGGFAGTGTLRIAGTGSQNLIGSAEGIGELPNVVIDKPSGLLLVRNTINIVGNFEYIRGFVDAKTFESAFTFFSHPVYGPFYLKSEGMQGTSMEFFDLTVYSERNQFLLASPLKVKGSLYIGDAFSTLNPQNNTIYVSRNWVSKGAFIPSTGTVVFESDIRSFIQLDKPENNEFHNVILDKSTFISTGSPVFINGELEFRNGRVLTNDRDLLTLTETGTYTGASEARFVNGPLAKKGNTAFTFPVGKRNRYAPISITSPAEITDIFSVEYQETGQPFGYDRDDEIGGINNCEFWFFKRIQGQSEVKVTMGWDENRCAIDGIGNLQNLRIVSWSSTKWQNLGNGAISGNQSTGTISSVFPIETGPVTLAETKLHDTQLQSTDCVSRRLSGSDAVVADVLPDATFYQFSVKNEPTKYSFTSTNISSNVLNISLLPDVKPNVVYTVNVRGGYSSFTGPYGSECIFTLYDPAVPLPDPNPAGIGYFSLAKPKVPDEQGNPVSPVKKLVDRFGNEFTLESIIAHSHTVDAGLFRLHFEDDNIGFNDPQNPDRLACLIRVCEDLSKLIIPAINPITGSSALVDIRIFDSGIMPKPLPGDPNHTIQMPGGTPGTASAYYDINPGQGTVLSITKTLLHGGVWKTINTGSDAWDYLVNSCNVTPTINVFYHGYLAINFPFTQTPFHTDFNTPKAINTVDLYSVILHELLHAFDFASFIKDDNGNSSYGNALYSVYDTYLQNGQQNLIDIDERNCYNAKFSGLIPPLTGNCTTPIIFAGTGINNQNQVVYNPATYVEGQSLSHFNCDNTTACPPAGGGSYIMNYCVPSQGTNTVRTPHPAEVETMCDIGYQTSGEYGIVPTSQYTHQIYNSCGTIIAGVNDFSDISSGTSNPYRVRQGESIDINNILINDVNAGSFTCLVVIGGDDVGTVSVTSGVSFTFKAADFGNDNVGTQLLRYIPVSNSGQRGNETFIFITIDPANNPAQFPLCSPTSCNIICNGDFENIVNPYVSELANFRFTCDNSPDLFIFDGNNTHLYTQTGATVLFFGGFGCVAPIKLSDPFINSGNNYIGLANSGQLEAIRFHLNRSLLPTSNYILSFLGASAPNFNTFCNGQITILASTNEPCLIPGTTSEVLSTQCNFPAPYIFTPINIGTVQIINSAWTRYEVLINGTNFNEDINFIILYNSLYGTYTYLDNVELHEILIDAGPDLTLCGTQGIQIITSTTSEFPLVSYSWLPSTDLSCSNCPNPIANPPITTTYTVTVTNANGCTGSDDVTITVDNVNQPFSAGIVSQNALCSAENPPCGGSASVNVTGGVSPFSYSWWNTGTQFNTQAINDICEGTYNLVVSDSKNCNATATVTISGQPALVSDIVSVPECGDPAITNDGNLTASTFGGISPYTYSWSNTQTGTTLTGLNAGLYTVTVTDANNCTVTNTSEIELISDCNCSARFAFTQGSSIVSIQPCANNNPPAIWIASPCPGSNYGYIVHIQNNGNVEWLPGTELEIALDNMGFDNITLNPCNMTTNAIQGAQTITFTLTESLAPGAICMVEFTTSNVILTSSGTWSTNFTIRTNCFTSGTPVTVSTILTETSQCSCDPNDKKVEPAGCGDRGFITKNQKLDYQIRFQNIGKGPAHDVVLLDNIDNNLDLTTFKFTGSNYPVSDIKFLNINNNKQLYIVYKNINLPPMEADTFHSVGYFKYSISPKPDLTEGATIENYTTIIFNSNAPIATNKVINTLVENPILTADAGSDKTVYSGNNQSTCTDLTASVTGALPPYAFFWSNGDIGETVTVCPQDETMYSVYADASGCVSKSDSVRVKVEAVDIRCGNNLDKVKVCHIPPGNPSKAKTLCIDKNDLQNHLAHGDYLGECNSTFARFTDTQEDKNNENLYLEFYPNPANKEINIGFIPEQNDEFTIQLFNISGQELMTLLKNTVEAGKLYKITFNTQNLPEGVYHV